MQRVNPGGGRDHDCLKIALGPTVKHEILSCICCIYLFLNGPIPASFSVYFRLFNMSQLKFKFKLIKALMVCLGFEPKVAEWKAQTNPLSYSCTPSSIFICLIIFHKAKADIYFNKRAPGSSLGWRKHF